MIKRNNYTHRQKILREDVQVAVAEDENGVLSFTAEIDLSGYDFPEGARVFLEAQRHTSFMRFACGTTDRVELPPLGHRKLTEIVGADGVAFRLKVVEPSSNQGAADLPRLIGLAEGLRPAVADKGAARSLLEVVPGEVPHEMWRLEFDESSSPILRLDKPLYAQRTALLGHPWFRTMILPAVFRAILTRIKLVEGYDEDSDAHTWKGRWMRVARQIPGVAKDPPNDQILAVDDWINEVVTAFCRRGSFREKFDGCWEQEAAS